MDENKITCVECLQLVDPNNHEDCLPIDSLNFDEYMPIEETDGSKSFLQTQPVQLQQGNNSNELGIESQYNEGKGKSYSDSEASLQTPTKFRNRSSNSPPVLETHYFRDQQQVDNSSESQRAKLEIHASKKQSNIGYPEASLQTPTKFGNRSSTSPPVLETHYFRDQQQQVDNSSESQRAKLENQVSKKQSDSGNPEASIQVPAKVSETSRSSTSSQASGTHNLLVQQGNNSSEFQSNACKREIDFGQPEAYIKTPTEITANKNSSASLRILETHNPGIQQNQSIEYKKSSFQPKESYSLNYNLYTEPYAQNIQMANLLANPMNPYPAYSSQWTEQNTFGNIRQQQYSSNNVNFQSNEKKDFNQENPQFNYGQTFASNTLQPIIPQNFISTFPTYNYHNGLDASGYLVINTQINYPKLEDRHASYAPNASMLNPDRNTSVGSYIDEQKKSQPVLQNTSPLNFSKRPKSPKDKELSLICLNKPPSTGLASGLRRQSNELINTTQPFSSLNTFSPCELSQKSEKKDILKMNTEMKAAQMSEAKNTPGKSERQLQSVKIPQENNADKSAQEKDKKLDSLSALQVIVKKTTQPIIGMNTQQATLGKLTNEIIQKNTPQVIGENVQLRSARVLTTVEVTTAVGKNTQPTIVQMRLPEDPQKKRKNTQPTIIHMGLPEDQQKRRKNSNPQKTVGKSSQPEVILNRRLPVGKEDQQDKAKNNTEQAVVSKHTQQDVKSVQQESGENTQHVTLGKPTHEIIGKNTPKVIGENVQQMFVWENAQPTTTIVKSAQPTLMLNMGLPVEEENQQKKRKTSTQQTSVGKSTQPEVIQIRILPEEERDHQETIKNNTEEAVVSKHTQQNVKKSAQQKNFENSQKKNAEKSAQQENLQKSSQKENVQKSDQQKSGENSSQQAENTQQENIPVFTGEGYETIDEFINALKDGTLYKRW